MLSSTDASPWLVWLVPIAGSLVIPLLARLSDKVKGTFAIGVGVASVTISLLMFTQLETMGSTRVVSSSIVWIPSLEISIGVMLDPLSCLFALLISFVGTFVLVYSLGYMAGEEGLTRYYSMILLFIGSMIGLVMADNLLQLFIFWEMVGFCSFTLVGFWYKRQDAVKSATQVLLMTKVGDVALLIAIILIYVDTGTLNITKLTSGAVSLSPSVLVWSSLLLLFGAIAKSAQFPMHTWLFAAMEAPTSVSCLLHGATMVKAGIYLLARTHSLFGGVGIWLSLMTWIGLATAFLSAALAFSTTDIKGVAAYSTISQIGYMMAGLGAATLPQSVGWFASIYHLVNHAFFQGVGFLSAGIIVHQIGTRDLRRMGGLMHDLPTTFAVSLITFLSRAAIPPFGGFSSKELLAEALLATKSLPLILLFYSTSALTVAYSLRLILLVYIRKKPGNLAHTHLHKEQPTMILPALVFAVLCGILGLLRDPMMSFLGYGLPKSHSQLSTTPLFLHTLSLIVGLVPVYTFYMKGTPPPTVFEFRPIAHLSKLLRRGYYFDTFYRTYIVKDTLLFTHFLNEGPEKLLCNEIPYFVASRVSKFARTLRTSIDTGLDRLCYFLAMSVVSAGGLLRLHAENGLDRLCYSVASGTMSGAKEVRGRLEEGLDKASYALAGKTVEQARGLAIFHTGIVSHFVLATVLGISVLSVLLLLVYYWR